jgi:hypothetical protein
MIIDIKMEVIAVAPVFDCVAFLKISMNGYPVGVLIALFTSPIQNKMARIMAKPSAPLRNMVKNMLRGTLIDASLTSSAKYVRPNRSQYLPIWHAPSKPATQSAPINIVKILYIPTKRTELVVKPTNHDRPSGYPEEFDHAVKTNSAEEIGAR